MKHEPPNNRIYLLWDGDCDFCRSWAGWFAQRDSRHRFTIIPYQEAPAPPMTPLLHLQAKRSVQVIASQGEQFSGAQAILYGLAETGWHPRLTRVAMHRPFIWPLKAAYRLIATNRKLFGRLTPRT